VYNDDKTRNNVTYRIINAEPTYTEVEVSAIKNSVRIIGSYVSTTTVKLKFMGIS